MDNTGRLSSTRIESFHLQTGQGRHQAEALVVVNGNDLAVTIGGGSVYHIGATALAVPRPSLADPEVVSASASVICVTGHKEDELARTAALRLAAHFNRIAVVMVGLHVDNATPQDITTLTSNFHLLLDQIASLPI